MAVNQPDSTRSALDSNEKENWELTQKNEVGGFYWAVLDPDIVNSGREKQGSISM